MSARLDLPVGPGDGSWTCDPRTLAGDLALIYRTAPLSDIAYLARADSDAFPVESNHARAGTATHACRYTVVAAFSPTLPYRDLNADSELKRQWTALRQTFRGSTFEVPSGVWSQLLSRLPIGDVSLESRLREAVRDYITEDDIKRQLVADMSILRRAGLTLDLVRSEAPLPGDQFADLVCRGRGRRTVVIELKRDVVKREHVRQILGYLAVVGMRHHSFLPPRGVLIGTSLHPGAQTMLKAYPRVTFVQLAALGFERQAATS